MTTDPRALAGQSMMFRFEGPVFTDQARAAFAHVKPAGVLFFADNITSRVQVHALCGELQAEARRLGMPPLLIAVDQEGGLVSRLPADFVTVPSAMAQSATGDPAVAEACARITGEQLREVGITLNYAPTLDINLHPENTVIRTRSFGDTVERVIEGGLATIRGLTAAGVIPTVKHFPGHGDTHVDSHLGLPVIDHGLEHLRAVELAPFRAAIAAGVPAVMSAHIVFPALDEHPATLSRPVISCLLREELGFDGVVFTDSLSMTAIAERYGLGDAAVRAKLAGVDVLESNEPLAHQVERVEAMTAALVDGRVPETIFRRSAARVATLRERFDVTYEVPTLNPPSPDRVEQVRDMARRSVTALGSFTPIPTDARVAVVDFQRFRASEAEDPVGRARVLREAVGTSFQRVSVVALSHTPRDDEIARATEATASAEWVVVVTRDASDLPAQVELARRIISIRPASASVIHVAARGPYDAGLVPEATATLLTYGDPAVSLRAVVDVLVGRARAGGSLPVSLPERGR
ncbi:MAG: glycoside hydrolase family 3 protein [Chloroflexota bacterium]|nr:glycoside hydrolase family 3 protein [Chloroflexota bacterium]